MTAEAPQVVGQGQMGRRRKTKLFWLTVGYHPGFTRDLTQVIRVAVTEGMNRCLRVETTGSQLRRAG